MLGTLHILRRGAQKMTKQQFRNALKRSIGADKEYAAGAWIQFQDSPMHYLCSRNPQEQAMELVKIMMKLGQKN